MKFDPRFPNLTIVDHPLVQHKLTLMRDKRTSTKDQLEQQALDAAKEVKRWGEPVTLPEMNAHDRRIIHVTLKDDPELTTESMGEGAMKKVVISLKKED